MIIRNKKTIIIIVSVVIVLLLGISIAYAALSKTITVTTNNVIQSAMTWDIGFDSGTVTGTAVVNNSGNVNCGSATATATTISGISVTLSEVGDKCAYTFSVKNRGTIGGKISTITVTKPTSTTCTITGSTMVCGDITYKLHYDTHTSSSLVAVGDVIAAMSGSSPTAKTVVLTIEHTGQTASSTDYNQSGFAYDILYGQY